MRNTAILVLLLGGIFLVSPVLYAVADNDYISFLGYLDADKAWNIVNDFSGDRFEGRRAGTQGAELVSEYIAGYFNSIGLQPAGTDGTYRTKFTLPLWELVQVPTLSLVDSSQGILKSFEYRRDFFVITGSGSGDFSAEVVFGGYGITAGELGYDDYSEVSVRGKIVLAIVGTPAAGRFSEGDYGHSYKKAENALKHGAVGLILVDSPVEPTPHYVERWRCYLIGACWTIYDGLALLGGSVQMADALLKDAGFTLDSLQQSIDRAVRPMSFALGKQLHVSVHAKFAAHADAYNVLGFIPGSDASSGKIVIIGAHYDHWGKDVNDEIFRGAEDNASGVAVVMEIARIFSAGVKPTSSVLFAAWAGEEEGLYGSYAYVNHPYFSLPRTIAYLNLDMVGNGEPLIFESSEAYTTLRAVTTDSAKQLGITIRIQGYEGGGDHAPFEEKKVPNLTFMYWPYEQFHTSSDTADHLSKANLLDTAKLTTLVALRLSEATVAPIGATQSTVLTTTQPIVLTSSEAELLTKGFESTIASFTTTSETRTYAPALVSGLTLYQSPLVFAATGIAVLLVVVLVVGLARKARIGRRGSA